MNNVKSASPAPTATLAPAPTRRISGRKRKATTKVLETQAVEKEIAERKKEVAAQRAFKKIEKGMDVLTAATAKAQAPASATAGAPKVAAIAKVVTGESATGVAAPAPAVKKIEKGMAELRVAPARRASKRRKIEHPAPTPTPPPAVKMEMA